jgi:5-methylcytosine-specific restriction endonuclease McrA
MVVEHVIPVSSGGSNEIENLVPACKACNSIKSNKTLHEFREILRCRHPSWRVKFSKNQIDFLEKDLGVNLPLIPISEFKFFGETLI